MSTPRKKWATRFDAQGEYRRHPSEAAVWRYVVSMEDVWRAGSLRTPRLVVYVDEGLGRGWEIFDRVNLNESPARVAEPHLFTGNSGGLCEEAGCGKPFDVEIHHFVQEGWCQWDEEEHDYHAGDYECRRCGAEAPVEEDE